MGNRWTPEDIERLKRLSKEYPATEIAEQLDRPVGGVVHKAMQLKLSLPSRQTIEKRV